MPRGDYLHVEVGRVEDKQPDFVSLVRRCTSTDFEILCRFLATITDDLILNNLPFIEGAQSCTLDG